MFLLDQKRWKIKINTNALRNTRVYLVCQSYGLTDYVNISKSCPTRMNQHSFGHGWGNLFNIEDSPWVGLSPEWYKREMKKQVHFFVFIGALVFTFILDVLSWFPSQTLQPPDRDFHKTLELAPVDRQIFVLFYTWPCRQSL